MKIKNALILLTISLFMGGCAVKKDENIYYWDNAYSSSVYEYLNQEGDANKQISDLENLIQTAYEKGKKVPPGTHAHLGLLYSNLGNISKSTYHLDKEMELFPESKAYISFLKNKNFKKGNKNAK